MEEKKDAGEATSADEVSILVLIVDTNPYSWGQRTLEQSPDKLDFSTFLQHLFVFLNAFLLLHHQNRLAVIAAHANKSCFLFPVDDATDKRGRSSDLDEVRKTLLHGFRQLADGPADGLINLAEPTAESALSAALSLALCYLNRMAREAPAVKPRLFAISCSPDTSAQYIPVMNAIFSAQKQSIPLDALVLADEDSTFLQQASHITGGIYLRPQHQQGLAQYLLSTFLADRYSRQLLVLPVQTDVDYRASCFCHKKIIDVGYVCSVCLSIFCTESAVCSTCNTKFALGLVGKLPPPKKKPAPSPSVPKASAK